MNKMIKIMVIGGIILLTAGYAHADIRKDVTIRPKAPIASAIWTNLPPLETAHLHVEVKLNEDGYRIKSGPDAEFYGSTVFWTGDINKNTGIGDFHVINESAYEKSPSVYVRCVWEPYGGGGGGHGPRPDDIEGYAYGVAHLKLPRAAWTINSSLQEADDESTINWTVRLIDDFGDPVGMATFYDINTWQWSWDIVPSQSPNPPTSSFLSGTVKASSWSRGFLRAQYSYLGRNFYEDSPELTFVEIEKMQYSIDGPWADLPPVIYLSAGSNINFKTLPLPSDSAWPTNRPTWTGAYAGTDGTASNTFTQPGMNYVTAKCGNTVTAAVVVVSVDLNIWNGGSDLDNGQTAGTQVDQVADADEETVGAYLLVNWDDDDGDGVMNADGTWSTLPVPDLTEDYVANEDNLAKLQPTVEPLLDTGTIELEVSGADAGKVKLWTQSTKGTEITLISNKKTWSLANSTEKADFQTFMNDGYWIEGTDGGTAERGVTFTARYKDSGGTEICKDDNNATVVMINLANVVARDNMLDLWGIGQNSRGHSALIWRYAGACTKADLTNDVNFLLIEMGGPTDNRNLTTITQQAGYPAYGCFRNPSMTHVQRLRIIQAARALAARAPITYAATDAVQPYQWDGALNTITALRCDSLVEACYEINGVDVWGMERDADNHNVHYPINDQADDWSYSTTWGTWTAGANNLPDNLEEHNDFDLFGWSDTFMPATQCGNVAPVEAETQLEQQDLCQPIGSTGGN